MKKTSKIFFLFSLFYFFLLYCQSRNYDKKKDNIVKYLAFCPDKTVSKCTARCIADSNCTSSSNIKIKKDGVKYYADSEAKCQSDCSSDCNKFCGTSLLIFK